ncbi:MAG: hypothetical protein R6V03_03555, partial [Kiritimatiellia bacterium]
CVNLTFFFYSGYPLAHSANVCLVTWGMYGLWRWMGQTEKTRWPVLAGLTLGYAVVTRHTSLLLAPCIAAVILKILWTNRRRLKRVCRPLTAAVAAYMFFPLCLLVYNAAVFGNAFRTGYALSGEQWAFSRAVLFGNLVNVAGLAFTDFLFLCLPLGMLGVVVLDNHTERAIRLFWIIPVFLLYASYYWFQPYYGFFRFVLILVPVLTGSAFALIDRVKAGAVGRYAGMMLLLLSSLAYTAIQHKHDLLKAVNGNLYTNCIPSARAAESITEAVDRDAVIFISRHFAYGIGWRKNYTLYNLAAFSGRSGRRAFSTKQNYTLAEIKRGVRPRRQESRAEELADFYENHTQEELDLHLQKLISGHISEGRQTVLIVPRGWKNWVAGRLGPGIHAGLLRSFAMPRRSGQDRTWDIYVLKTTAVPAGAET